MRPGRFTELFFLDEATAFAAGHRPCAECRREDYERFLSLWRRVHPGARGADDVDDQLHSERVDPATRAPLHHGEAWDSLPDGTFVLVETAPYIVLSSRLQRWSPAGYLESRARPEGGGARVITPPSVVAVLRHGWDGVVPFLHPSAVR